VRQSIFLLHYILLLIAEITNWPEGWWLESRASFAYNLEALGAKGRQVDIAYDRMHGQSPTGGG